MLYTRRAFSAAAAAFGLLPTLGRAAPEEGPLSRPAVMTNRAPRVTLLGAAQAGRRVVAVGERGVIVVSDDEGSRWRQVRCPASVTLTSVAFGVEGVGCAVGHSGAILRTDDAGESWNLVLDGLRAARTIADQAQAAGGKQLSEAQRIVEEGADKPFLDVCFVGQNRCFAVGAYGLAFESRDAGRTWRPLGERLENSQAAHLYSVASNGKAVFICGEQGFLARSLDAGGNFSPIALPYKGSLFTQSHSLDGQVLLAGLRGNAFWGSSPSEPLTQVAVAGASSIGAAVHLRDGRAVLGDQAGKVWVAARGSSKFDMAGVSAPMSALLQVSTGDLLGFGVAGPVRPLGTRAS